jgi:uncharacterized RDD family membrane protein YckC
MANRYYSETVTSEPPWSQPATALAVDAAPLRPAGVWRRALALGVDLLALALILRAGDLLAVPLGRWDPVARAFRGAFELVAPAAYFVLAHGTGGQTPGKMLLGVRVVARSGDPVGYARALGRYLAAWLSALPLGLGFLLAACRADRRALHDLLAGTRVVRARSAKMEAR